jgi:uncharacterized membrane protein YoaK (UPF0700 family)
VAWEHGLTVKLLGIPVFFLAGCAATALAVARNAHGGRALVWVMALECALLTALTIVLSVINVTAIDAPRVQLAAFLGLAAMGVQSAMVRLLMNGVASTNVMTTNTTQLAIDCTLMLLDRHGGKTGAAATPLARAAHERLSGTLPIALGFVLGTVSGALGYAVARFVMLLVPLAISYALLAWMLSSSRRFAS